MHLLPKTVILFTLPCFLLLQNTFAQRAVVAKVSDFQEYSIEQISLEQGLSQGMVYGMVQDQKGYIWVATKEGLNRYDGTGFKVFRHSPDDSLSISSNMVSALTIDNKQRLWIGTAGSGLNLFDPATESFIRFKHEPGNPRSIPSNIINCISIDGNGSLIYELEEAGQVVMIEKPGSHKSLQKAFEFKPIEKVYPQLKIRSGKRFAEVARLHFSSGGDLWYYVNDTIFGYTAEMMRNGSEVLKFSYPREENLFYETAPPFFFDTKQNRTFITSFGNVLKQFDHNSKTFVPILQLPPGYSFNRSVFIDDENNVWSPQPDNNLIKVNLTDGKMTVIKLLLEKANKDVIAHCSFAFEGLYGNLWMRSAGYGIFKISARNKLFKQDYPRSLLIGNSTWSQRIEQVGVKASFNPKDLEKLIDYLSNTMRQSKGIYMVEHYSNFALDKNGVFWTVSFNPETRNNSIARIDPATNTYKEYNDTYELSSHHYGSPIFLDNGGEVWFGERLSKNGINLYHLNQNENRVEAFPFPVKYVRDEYQFIADYHQDINGLFWLATRQGLFTFHPATKQWQHFTNKSGDASSLSSNLLLSLCPDPVEPSRYLWIGTEGSGLNKFDIHKKAATRFNVKDGLPNDVIYGIQSDAHNNLWISTNNGICRFNPQTLETRNFTEADGLVSNEFNRYEFSKTADGTLYFGSPTGVNYFQPEDFYKKEEPSAVVINKLGLLNKEVVYQHQQNREQSEDFSLSAPIEYCKELVFNYDHRMITLGFALLDLTTPERNLFKYKLEGFDKDWIDAGTKNEATYTNLNPGSYTFKVLGCNSSNVWSTVPTELKIIVLSPWWGTWWFRSMMVIVFVGLLYAFYRYRLSKALELERVRNRIAQDLHDEMGSTLSSISLYSAAIQKNSTSLSQQNHSILSKISQSTTKMMESMNDMVWTIKADNDSFEHVVNRMRAFAVNMTEAKDIVLHFNADARTEKLQLNMEQRKNIYLLFKETINNAVKYSACNNIYVAISQTEHKLEIRIKDDGVGFELETVTQNNLQLGGNGLRGMKLRAKQIQADLQIHTGEGLGSEVVFSMPLK